MLVFGIQETELKVNCSEPRLIEFQRLRRTLCTEVQYGVKFCPTSDQLWFKSRGDSAGCLTDITNQPVVLLQAYFAARYALSMVAKLIAITDPRLHLMHLKRVGGVDSHARISDNETIQATDIALTCC